MPAAQPFTQMCQLLAQHRPDRRVDLHVHTTASDGQYTPRQIVDLARRSGLPAIAITDHDTFAGIAAAQQWRHPELEVIPGVEITTEHLGKEVHLLAYFVSVEDSPLRQALEVLCASRRERFFAMAQGLRERGVPLDLGDAQRWENQPTLGRRHLAELLVKGKHAATIRHAFQRFLHDQHPLHVAKAKLPIVSALRLVREAGGVSSWAHPGTACTRNVLHDLATSGLDAVEVDFPAVRYARGKELRGWARELGLAVTGGSDCHGPEPLRQAVGSGGITVAELGELRNRRR